MVVNFEEFDCVTLVENVLALVSVRAAERSGDPGVGSRKAREAYRRNPEGDQVSGGKGGWVRQPSPLLLRLDS